MSRVRHNPETAHAQHLASTRRASLALNRMDLKGERETSHVEKNRRVMRTSHPKRAPAEGVQAEYQPLGIDSGKLTGFIKV